MENNSQDGLLGHSSRTLIVDVKEEKNILMNYSVVKMEYDYFNNYKNQKLCLNQAQEV
jgi:hypothetical protein